MLYVYVYIHGARCSVSVTVATVNESVIQVLFAAFVLGSLIVKEVKYYRMDCFKKIQLQGGSRIST